MRITAFKYLVYELDSHEPMECISQDINNAIKEGWQPFAPATITPNGLYHIMPMVKLGE